MLQNERYRPGEMKESWGLFFSSLLCCHKLGRLIEMRGVWWTSRLINQPWNLTLTLETLSTGLSYSALPVWQSDSQNCFVDAAELWRRKASLLITRPSWPLTVVHLPPKGSFHESLGGSLSRACILNHVHSLLIPQLPPSKGRAALWCWVEYTRGAQG